jgi:hypothetical protein
MIKLTQQIVLEDSEYKKLIDDSRKLEALERGGGDNWKWYDDALKEYYKGEEAENGWET